MKLDGLVNKQGLLAETFQTLDPNTIQHASEITNDRRDNKELRKQWFWTADSSLYRVEDNEAVLYFGQRDTNLIFRNIEDATQQLLRDNNYVPSRDDIKSVLDSVETGSTLRIKLSDLGIRSHGDEWYYGDKWCGGEWDFFEISISDYDSLNGTQRTFAERVYGQGDDFEENMKMFKYEGYIHTTRIYVLNPDYVKKHVQEDSAIARVSRLYYFGYYSDFSANVRDVANPDYALRGVPFSR